MSEISPGERDYLNSQLRDAAIVLDEAEHSKVLRKGDSNFTVAQTMVRNQRRVIESTSDRTKVAWHLKELDDGLSLVDCNN